MHPGFSLNVDPIVPDIDAHFKKLGFSSTNYPESPENKFIYDFVTPVLDEGVDAFRLPDHAKAFFNSDDKSSFDFKKLAANQPMFAGRGDNGIPMNVQNNYAKMAAFPQQNMPLNQFNAMNTNMKPNMSNERNLQGSNSKDKNTSMNNISRDNSRNGSRLDISGSKRNNISSKTNLKGNKSYQVAVNDDINLIERIEVALNQITLNHSKVCPFCSKTIDIKKCNFQNISAFLSNTSKKYYLTHFDCYLKSNSNPDAKVLSLANVAEARINSQINALTNIETSNYLRSDKKAYFVNIEGYHPISSFMLFKVEKICNGLEHASHRNQLLYINFATKTTSIFEPNAYMLPYSEFRLVITIHMSQSNEDPYTFEFLLDFSQVKLSLNQKSKFAEAFYLQGGNNIILGTEIVFDPANELNGGVNQKNLDSSFQSTGSVTPGKPDFGKNLYVVLKNLSVSLPLKRIETRPPEISSRTSLDEVTISSKNSSGQKKPLSKLQLNPNAPLFSNHHERGMEQVPQQKPYYPQNDNGGIMNFNQNNNNNFFQPGPGQRQNNNNNTYFNAPLFPPNLQFDQPLGNQLNSSADSNEFNFTSEAAHAQDDFRMPPGLFMAQPQSQQMNIPFNNNPLFPNQVLSQPTMKGGRSLYIETKAQAQQDPQSFIKEEDEPVETPEMPHNRTKYMNQDESPQLRVDRNKTSKGQHNLYTAVLSGKLKEASVVNSPALNKIHNHYFSEISNPGSAINTPEANTPVYSRSRPDFMDSEEVSTPQWTEDMMDNFKVEDYVGRLAEFAKTYNGSRVLQRFFPRANQQDVEIVIHEIQDKIEELMLDPYANYMFQTLAQSCSSEQRYFLLKKIAPSMIRIACDRKGTHSLQAIISLINRDVEDRLIKDTLEGRVVELAFDAQGTHLIQKLIVAISINNIDFIYRPIVERFLDISNHAFGLCVLKQLMAKVDKTPEKKREIIHLLHRHFEELIQNPYGNYAIQHALDIYPKECDILFEKVVDRIIQYSNQKFSSNVVEKCISIGAPEIRRKYVKEILRSDRIVELMKNKYGNYVILKILATAELEDKQAMMQSLIKNINLVNVTKYKNRWIQFVEENPLKIPGIQSMKAHRPSQFRNNSGMDNYNNSPELNSPMTADDWNNLRQAAVKIGSREIKDDKSHFFHENTKNLSSKSNSRNNVDDNAYDNGSRNSLNNQHTNSIDHDRNTQEMRYDNSGNMNMAREAAREKNTQNNLNGQGQKGEAGTANNKKGKNPNHKFYAEKNQHHKDKWGYNYFY